MITTLRLGMFIVATLLILAAGVFFIGSKDLRFNSTYLVRADFQNVAGLIEGAPVRVGGIHKGTVKRIDLPDRPDGQVTVQIELDSATQEIVKKDSVASIMSQGLLGDKYVEISFGSSDAERLKDGESIASEPPVDMANLIKKADEILDSTSKAVHNAGEATGELRAIGSRIRRGDGTLGALINDKTMYEQASAGASAFRENMEALKHNILTRGFFKKRGYDDSSELTRNKISRLPRTPSMETFAYDARQIFDKPDTAKLRNQKRLNEAGRFLEEKRFGLAVVVASAGMKGDAVKQRVLTEARAAVVRDYLAENFQLDDTRIKTVGLGKTREPGEGGKIEILVYPIGPRVSVAQGQTASR